MNIKENKHSSVSCRVHSHRPINRIVVVLSLFAIITIYSLITGGIANADVAEDIKKEVESFKQAQKVTACKDAIYNSSNTDCYLNEKALNDMGKMPISAGVGGFVTDMYNPFDEGVRGGLPDGRKRIQCDVIWLSGVAGKSDYFAKYFSEHAQLNSDDRISDSNQLMISNVPDTGIVSSPDKVRERLNANNLRGLKAQCKFLRQAVSDFPVPKLSPAAEAQLYKDAVDKYCSEGGGFIESSSGAYQYVVKGEGGKYEVKQGDFNFNSKKKQDISVWASYKNNNGQADMNCEEAVQKYSNLAGAYAEALNKEAQNNPDKNNTDATEPEGNKDECAAELNGFGSIICSGQNLFETITNILYGTIAKMLVDQTELTKSDTVRKHWGNFLNVANIILIIAFLVVIYSTATSTGGLSNYDVKKLLPRIIIFAIAINLSFYICMALVDLSTIVGKGIFGLLMGGSTGAPPQLINSAQKTAGEINSFVVGVALVAIAAVLVILVGAPIILALLAIVFALVVRGIALMILVIISPVAIALYLFNNQGLSKGFTMWRDNYIKLLLVYPLFMLVWGGTRVVSGLVNQGDQDGINALFVLLVETICLITPALSIMPLFKASGDIMGKATLMAATNGAANKFAGWAGSKATGARDKVGKAIGGAVAGAAGAAAGRAAGAVQNMRGGASTGNIATQLDDQAMNSARNKVDKYSASDRHEAFTTGQINGQTLKPYEMRAVIEKELPNASSTDVKQSMYAVNNEAQRLKKNGQNADADKLLRTFATTASANKNSQMSSKSLNNFANSGGWSISNMGQFEAKYADAVADYATNEMTAQDIAGADAANLAQMRQTLQYSASSGGSEAAADAGMRSMARQSNIALSDPSLTSKMNAQTASELRDNTLLRSTAGEKLANTHKIPNIYHDYNAGGGSSAIAKLHANKMMRHSDFGKLDAIDQSRLRAIASASVPTGTGAPTTPVAIASWDRRA